VAEAQRERRRVSAILRSTVDVILLVDAQGLVQLMNPAAERLLSQVADEAVGRPIDQVLIHRPLLDVYRHAVASPGSDAVQTAEATLDNGATYLVTITLVRDEDHTFLGRVVALKDITPLKQLDRYKSQMLQMASHDLRTPLGVATGYVELLGSDLQPLTPLRSKLLQGLESSLERMESLITELLDVERVESGVDVTRVPLDVRQLAEMVVQELQDVANRRQQTLRLDEPPQIPSILGDPVQLKQAFSNLVDNALKYTPEGGQVWVRLKQSANEVVFEVQDTGYGIPLAVQSKLFQRFYRAKVPGTETTPGTGLGLSLVKAIVEQHGGRVAVESVEKQGSTFRVWLPAAGSNEQRTMIND
jgi:two-component system phosphate regulon sensor histidine kinase PhoR